MEFLYSCCISTWILYAHMDYLICRILNGMGTMSDILVIVLGTGGILLMAAYAALCERI